MWCSGGAAHCWCGISDGSGFLNLRFFYFSRAQMDNLARGTRLRCAGEVRRGPQGLEMVHPEYRRIGTCAEPLEDRLTPIYPLTEGVTQGRVRASVNGRWRSWRQIPREDLLPADVVAATAPAPAARGTGVHASPAGGHFAGRAGRRAAIRRSGDWRSRSCWRTSFPCSSSSSAYRASRPLRCMIRTRLSDRFVAALPFTLTGAQQRVLGEVASDLQRELPMMRLIQGDVGCGKTVIAAAAAARAVGSGGQAALMAPTELLAEQHWRTLDAWFRPLGITVALLSGSQPARTRRSAIAAVASGEVHIAVGTHALFQEGVTFQRLALVIVDEQHRFGVQQRMQLKEKGRHGQQVPHQLIMTATPIPRTLAMTAYADLDVSVIDELPPGRVPIRTVVLAAERRAEVVERIHHACREGKQAYWVCPLIDESDELRAQAAEETAASLVAALPDVRIGLVHGRMPPRAKEKAMHDFKAGRTQLLVATTVIEVGVDVPNASLMVIENAERMGLAQLHQLRGRVGRGSQRAVACCCTRRRCRNWPASGSRRFATATTASRSRAVTWNCAVRANCWARARPDLRNCASPT